MGCRQSNQNIIPAKVEKDEAVECADGPIEIKEDIVPKPLSSNTPGESQMKIEHVFDLHYTRGRILGSGGFSTAIEAISKLNPEITVAAKITKKKLLTLEDVEGIKSEIRIMKNLHHKNIVGYIDDFEDDDNYYVCLELLQGGELFDRIVKKTTYNELDARGLFTTIVQAVKFLHDQDIVHRDLKPENLLMLNESDDTSVKIADFGFAKEAHGFNLRTLCGSPGYVAPEILMKRHYGKPVDMWAIGVITYIILAGYPPFYDDMGRQPVIFDKIKRGEYDFDPMYWSGVSEEAKDLISKLLCVDPVSRLTAGQCLKHPWLFKNELEKQNLGENLTRLKKFNAARKLKAATKVIIAVRRMSLMLGNAEDSPSNPGVKEDEERSAEVSPVRSKFT